MATNKKSEEKTTKEEVKSLRSELDAITFKNKQARDIAAMQKSEQKLKDKLARNRERRVGGTTKISGLGKLGRLETFKQKYKDYQ
jgi:hypothetical protein